MSTKINLRIYQGATFTQIIRYESASVAYATITAIPNTAPLVVTAPSHGMVAGWRCKITGVAGMTEVNSNDYKESTNAGTDTITFNGINPVTWRTYTSGGVVEYNTPVDLAGMTARMQIRSTVTSDTVIDELTSAAGDIVIDNALKTITVTIPADVTATYTFRNAVYSIELVSGTVVTPLAFGNIALETEVTR